MFRWCRNTILRKLNNVIDKENVFLYKDDGLAILKSTSVPETELERKEIIKIFRNLEHSITKQNNLKTVDFQDTQFDLKNEIYTPYRKTKNDQFNRNIKINPLQKTNSEKNI